MEEAADEKKVPLSAQVIVEEDRSVFVIDGLRIEIARNSDVTIFKTSGVKMRPGIAEVVARKDSDAFEVSKAFNKIAAFGAQVDLAENGGVVVSTNGEVKIEPPTADGEAGGNRRRERVTRVPGVGGNGSTTG